ncbi:MAG: autotransporter domain-containing protein [Phycisphaerales bacterium]|nr:autotransporter domain-containing protein [Phycisphaerales bacterium]
MPVTAQTTLEPSSISTLTNQVGSLTLITPGLLAGTVTASINTSAINSPTLTVGGTTYTGAYLGQTNGSKVAAFGFNGSLVLSAGATLNVTGSNPLVLYSTGDINSSANISLNGGDGGSAPIVQGSAPGQGGVAAGGGFNGGVGGSAASYYGLAANGSGAGGGTGGPAEGSGGGGGFGGSGGTGFVFPNAGAATTPVPGGPANGDLTKYLQGGSGAGGGSGKVGFAGGGGGAGGGALGLIAGGAVLLNGAVVVNGGQGGDGYYGGGGGAGGGVLIASLGASSGIGAGGNISADGGDAGSFPGYAGGGGGGGRVEVYLHQWNVGPGSLNVSVAPGTYAGNASYSGVVGVVGLLADSTYISAGNSLKVNGTGSSTTLETTGAASYSSPLTFQTSAFPVNGALTLTNATQTIQTLSGSGTITLTGSNIILDPALAVSSSFNGSISGNGSVTLDGPGNFTLGGTNSYTGGTFINGGVLSIVSSAALGSGALTFAGGTLALPGTVTITNTVTVSGAGTGTIEVASGTIGTMAGVISGGGSLIASGGGTLNLSAANTYTGGTTVADGTLETSSGGTLGPGTLTVNSGAQFISNGVSQTITGLAGGGQVSLGGGSLAINVPTGSLSTFTGNISGAGSQLTIDGTGTQVLGADNTFTGGVVINSGASLVAGSLNALGGGLVVNSGSLAISSPTYQANINGAYIQNAIGALGVRISGVNPGQFDQYSVTGGANVNGTLNVTFQNGYTLATPTQNFAVLTATGGSVGNFTSVNLGNHPINTFANVMDTGNGINLELYLSQPSLVPYALTGNQQAFARYLDLTDGFAGGTPSAEYQALINQIDSLYSSQVPTALDQLSGLVLQVFPQVALQNSIGLDETFNQHAQALDDGASGWSQSIFALNTPGVLDSSQMALSQMLDQQSQILSLDALPLTLPNGTQIPMAQQPQAAAANWSAFLTGALQLENYSSADSISNPKVTAEGLTLGGDYAVSSTTSVGALFAYAHNDIRLDSFGSKGSMDSYTPGVYANFHTPDGWFTDALAAYSYNSYSEHRNLSVGGISQTASGTDTGNQGDLSMDAGRQFSADNNAFNWIGPWTLIPMASLAYTYSNFNSYAESGAGAASLNVGSMEANSLRSTISLQVLYTLQLSQSFALQPGLLVGWRHEFLNGPQGITSSLQGAGPGQSFTITTEPPSKDTGIFGGSLQATINQSVNAFVNYQIDLGSQNLVSQRLFAGVAVKF